MQKEHQKLKTVKKSLASKWKLYDIREVHFGTYVLALHCYSGDKK